MQVMNEERARKAAAAREGKNRVKGKGHPTTADMDYSPREWEFMQAMQEFKRLSGRQFPTWCEVLRVIDALGYEKVMTPPALCVRRVA